MSFLMVKTTTERICLLHRKDVIAMYFIHTTTEKSVLTEVLKMLFRQSSSLFILILEYKELEL